MKKFTTLVIILSAAMLIIGCGNRMGGQVEGKTFISEGWVDENTFRVTAVGIPGKDAKSGQAYTNTVQRKATAKEAALTMAQKRIIEKFVGARLEGASGAVDYQSTGTAVAKEFSGLEKGGTIVKETYDKDDNCEIVYQVEKKGLKREVQGGASVSEK